MFLHAEEWDVSSGFPLTTVLHLPCSPSQVSELALTREGLVGARATPWWATCTSTEEEKRTATEDWVGVFQRG